MTYARNLWSYIEQRRFLSVPHLLWHGASVYHYALTDCATPAASCEDRFVLEKRNGITFGKRLGLFHLNLICIFLVLRFTIEAWILKQGSILTTVDSWVFGEGELKFLNFIAIPYLLIYVPKKWIVLQELANNERNKQSLDNPRTLVFKNKTESTVMLFEKKNRPKHW